ncbi:hypothetical protein I4U23_025899 [Adineta vaga]|nr:hypothetical protein I4U23_025899 [Adineta vaga]
MSGINSDFKSVDLNKHSDINDSFSFVSTSPCSFSSFSSWKIQYKSIPRKFQSKGVWDGYQTKDDFMTMHLR